MKNICIYAFLIFLLSSIGLTSSVYAADVGVKEASIEYALPFPGMLPNNPLYFIKSFRDMLIEKLISSDVKKAEFYILQADKRLQMSVALSSGDNKQMAETMRSDAFTYREKSFEILRVAIGNKSVVPRYVVEKLLVSSKKHKEVLMGMNTDATLINNLIPKIEELLRKEIDKK